MRSRRNNLIPTEFDKTQFIDPSLVDKVTLWMLRIIIDLGAAREFINNNNYFDNDTVAYFLDLGKFVEMDTDDYKRIEVLSILRNKLVVLEKRKKFSISMTLEKNIKQVSKLMDLNRVEEQILEFFILSNQFDILSKTSDFLGSELNSTQAIKAVSVILDIPLKEINLAFKSGSKLNTSSIIKIDKANTYTLDRKITIISDSFADDMLNLDEDVSEMIKDAVRACDKSSLKLRDYQHILKDVHIIISYLRNVVSSKQTGVNILFYGPPGTGKTELAKVISQSLKTKLFEISYADENDEPIDGQKRLGAFKISQSLLSNKRLLLMYDEAEDIFDSSDSAINSYRQKNKAWLNRMLETNSIPTIWITNNIHSIDSAIVRRFDFSIELPVPDKAIRTKMIKKYSNNILDKSVVASLAENENLAPALISRAIKVVSAIDTDNKSKTFTHVLNNTLKAQGFDGIKDDKKETFLPNTYNPNFINTSTNLVDLVQGVKKHQNARICLYGPAGTGKSAFGKYIAEKIKRSVLFKKVSDLQSPYIGVCEQNIANAFKEAKESKSVLIFDEVDSFLMDRSGAQRSWEISQVNEMLVQMENFDGIFVATTNLMDNLDKASLRRFDLKLEFGYLQVEQSWNIFLANCKDLKIRTTASIRSKVKVLKNLTPGDFAAVTRQNRFRPIQNAQDFVERLQDEIAVKNVNSENIMGFVR